MIRCSKRTLYCCFVLFFGTAQLDAAKHPVPLDKNADSKQCLECHEGKSKGKVVHSAISTGCASCHEVRVNKDITRIKLTQTSTHSLCISCHADKDAEKIKSRVHSPAVLQCDTCHAPHTSEYKNNLLKPTSGNTKDENLCLGCHAIGIEVPKGGSRHAALDGGCDTCHVTHKTGEAGKAEFDYHLTKAMPQLCFDCHDPNDAALKTAHSDQPFATADCMTCHEPHQSANPKLMQKFVHAPFTGKDSCNSCHRPAVNGKVVLTEKDSKSLCLTCHDEKAKQIESAKVQHPGAQGDCTDCHSAHAGKAPGMPKPDAVNACLGCHSDQAAQQKKQHLHQPAFQQGCATCHEPHGGNNAKLLRSKNANALCLECHGPERSPQKIESDHVVTIFDGKVKLPEGYFQQFGALPLKYGHGHPVDRHPVQDAPTPGDPGRMMQINCLTCHQPHSSTEGGLLVKDQANDMAFCDKCHQQKFETLKPAPAAEKTKDKAAAAGTPQTQK